MQSVQLRTDRSALMNAAAAVWRTRRSRIYHFCGALGIPIRTYKDEKVPLEARNRRRACETEFGEQLDELILRKTGSSIGVFFFSRARRTRGRRKAPFLALIVQTVSLKEECWKAARRPLPGLRSRDPFECSKLRRTNDCLAPEAGGPNFAPMS